jgi:hypothetical protein
MADERTIFSGGDVSPVVLYASRAIGDAGAYQLLQDASGNLLTAGAVDAGKTLTTSSGTTSLTLSTVVLAVADVKTKVYAYSLTTTSATEVVFAFMSGATRLWEGILMAPAGASAGANIAVSPPTYLFAPTLTNTSLTLSLGTAVAVHFSVAYFQE